MFNKSILIRIGFLLIIFGFISGCQDPILVGGTLLDDEKLEIGIVNNFDITSKVLDGERIITYSPIFDNQTYLLGELDDPLYGNIAAELYLKFRLGTTKPNYLTETKLRFDSLVLVLQYDTLGTYGNTSGAQSIKVFELDEAINEKDTLYSDIQLKFLPNEVCKVERTINPKDSVRITNHLTKAQVTQAPQLRLRLDDQFGDALIKNDMANNNDTLLGEYLKGLYLTSTSQNNRSFMYGFNFTTSALATTAPINKLIMYYTVNDTTAKVYEYLIHTATVNRFVHKRVGSQAESFITNATMGDSLCFLQGIGGIKSVIQFNDLSALDTLLINKAELEITVAEIPVENGVYRLPRQLIATRKNENGRQVLIDDIAQLLASNVTNFSPVFGGTPLTTGNQNIYNLNITNHIKRAVKDKNYNADLYLNVITEGENPSRVVFYGAKHSQYPVKLKITYTKN